MLEQLLTFITPGPLTERFGFQTRVFTSWISFGLVLGLITSIVLVSSGTVTPDGVIVFVLQSLIVYPITICFLGLIGLGIDSMRGDAEHPGWYWWLFPIVAYIVIGFWLFLVFITVLLSIAGVNIPTPRRRTNGRRITENNLRKIRQEVKQQQSKKFLDKYEDKLMQLHQEEMKRLQREQLEEQEKKERLKTLSIRERILLKIRENPGALLEDFLTEDEMEELGFMLLEASL